MKRIHVSIVFVVLTFMLMSFVSLKTDPITVYIIGDSTAANKEAKAFPETGWGMEFQSFFLDAVKVENRAMNGRSTKSFINEKRWAAVLETLKEGDFVLIEFGHNDEKIDKPAIGTSLIEFRENLLKFVQDTKAKKATPILLTPIARRNFVDGVLVDTHLGYPSVVRKLADSLHIPLIDMQQKTTNLLTALGEEGSVKLFNHVPIGDKNYPEGKKDNTHLSPLGAKTIAKLVVEGLREQQTSMVKYLKN